MRRNYYLPLIMFLIGCQSSVNDMGTAKEAASQLVLKTGAPGNAIRVLNNSTDQKISTCKKDNSLTLEIERSMLPLIRCAEESRLQEGLKLGAVCDGGVVISPIENRALRVYECEKLPICGVIPSISSNASGEASDNLILEYKNLPWGCAGKISYFLEKDADQLDQYRSVDFKISPSECVYCPFYRKNLCGTCPDDTVPPIIKSVVTKEKACNQISITIEASDENSGLAVEPYSFDGGKTWFHENVTTVTGTQKDWSVGSIMVRDVFGNKATWNRLVSGSASPCGCDLPWGGRIAHGETVKAYSAEASRCEQSCEEFANNRSCNNGTLEGSATLVYQSCRNGVCRDCTKPWDQTTIKHREFLRAYSVSSVSCTRSCATEYQDRQCFDGRFQGDNRFIIQNCIVEKCACTIDGRTFPHGTVKTAYSVQEASCSPTCSSQSINRTCDDGRWTGDNQFAYLSCQYRPCSQCNHNGRIFRHGDQIRFYDKSSVLNCNENSCENHSVTRTCRNGSFQPPVNTSPFNRLGCGDIQCEIESGSGDRRTTITFE